MEINQQQVYRVLLNHLPLGKRINIQLIRSLTDRLPDAVILGFGRYDHYNMYYLVVFSPTFPINLWSAVSNLSWHQATGATTAYSDKTPPTNPGRNA